MAVKPPDVHPIRSYGKRYNRYAIVVTVIMQLILSAFVGIALVIGGVPLSPIYLIVIVAVAAASIGLNIIIIRLLLIPLRELIAALSHTSGEPTDLIPPNPNAAHYERDGLKPLLQFIYESATEKGQSKTNDTHATTETITKALDQTSAGLVIFDSSGAIQYANKRAPITTDSAKTPALSLLFDESDTFQKWLAECRKRAVHAEKHWLRIADRIIGEEGRRIYDVTATYEKGSAAEVILVAFDRTELYQPEDDDLDFIAFAAHELRGPITVIRGYLDVLGAEVGESMQPDQQELLKRLVVSSNRLSGYINNILNASRYDRRHLQIHLTEQSLAEIYSTINDDMQLRAQSQGRLLNIAIRPDLPTVAADPSSLSEVIGNLIDNALKYSNEGGAVTVTADVEGNYIKVSVEDHGIGMPSNVVANLFHKFYRSHRSRETVAGTGIGLYICKAIVESHGGTIGVKSKEGHGSTFTFTVPIYASVADKLQADGFSNQQLISNGGGWIKNHTMYKS